MRMLRHSLFSKSGLQPAVSLSIYSDRQSRILTFSSITISLISCLAYSHGQPLQNLCQTQFHLKPHNTVHHERFVSFTMFFFVFYQIWICFSQIYHSFTFTLTSGDFCWLSRQQSLAGPISNTSITGKKKQNLNRIEFYYLDIYQRKILTRPVYMPDVIPFNLNYLSSGQDEWFGLFYGQRYNYLLDK